MKVLYNKQKNKTKIVVYVYSGWHPSSYRRSLGRSWTEWELIKSAKPLFKGHQPTESPLWGYYDDSNPLFVKKQINTAIKYKIDTFIFTYYWDKKPIFNEGIDKGFLRAENNKKINFAFLWSPRLPRLRLPLPIKLTDDADRATRNITLNQESILKFIKFCAKQYFWRSNYLKINNRPVLYFFQYYKFIEALGGDAATKSVFKKADIFLKNLTFDGLYPIGTSDYLNFVNDLKKTGFRALTSYNLLGNYQSGPPIQDYTIMTKKRIEEWQLFFKKGGVPYFPSVSLGFDASCRGERKMAVPKHLNGRRYYPWYPIIVNFKSSTFKLALKRVFQFLKIKKITPPIIHITSWNEWSEGNHLEPGRKSKFKYLKLLEDVYKNCFK